MEWLQNILSGEIFSPDSIQALFTTETGAISPMVVVAAGAVVGLAMLVWLYRKLFGGRSDKSRRDVMPRLSVTDSVMVDNKRHLVLVRRDDMEHLVMIGGPTDLVVETDIVHLGRPLDREGVHDDEQSEEASAYDSNSVVVPLSASQAGDNLAEWSDEIVGANTSDAPTASNDTSLQDLKSSLLAMEEESKEAEIEVMSTEEAASKLKSVSNAMQEASSSDNEVQRLITELSNDEKKPA